MAPTSGLAGITRLFRWPGGLAVWLVGQAELVGCARDALALVTYLPQLTEERPGHTNTKSVVLTVTENRIVPVG